MTAVATTTTSTTVTTPKGAQAPIPEKTKRIRYLIVGTVFFSAYSIFLSIKMFRYTILPFIPTSLIAAWTLAMLFPLEVAHHGLEFTGEDRAGPTSWIVEKATIRRALLTSAAWAVCCARSMFLCWYRMNPTETVELITEGWLLASLEFGTAATLYLLTKLWSEVHDESRSEPQETQATNSEKSLSSPAEKTTVSSK